MQVEGKKQIDFNKCFSSKKFDRTAVLADLNYFKYYFLTLGGIQFHEERLEEDFQVFSDYLLAADSDYFLFRDF
jgi:hypothetical protein